MSSNYPPGVTGNEYAIGGAQSEWLADATCPECGRTGEFEHESHFEFGVRAFCTNTECKLHELGFYVPDPTDYDVEPELGRGEDAE